MSKKTFFKSLLNKHPGRSFLIYCPGKNILEWRDCVNQFIKTQNLITIGSNRITDLIIPHYHMFTNNSKYERYGNLPHRSSTILIGSHIADKWLSKHNPSKYVLVNYTDRDRSEPISYDAKKDIVRGYYRTSGNLSIMLANLMGAKKIYIAGMSGFTHKFDGTVHYYQAEIKRDVKAYKEWLRKYYEPVARSLDNLKSYGIEFKIITPTIYKKHFDKRVLEC